MVAFVSITMISKIKMVPGCLTAEDVFNYAMMTEKYCIDCGSPLNFWGTYAKLYHSLNCKYQDEKNVLMAR